MTGMQDELVRGLRRQVLRTAADEEEAWGSEARPEVSARLREQADELE